MMKKQKKKNTPGFGQFQRIKGFEHFTVRLEHSEIRTFQYMHTVYSNTSCNAHNESIVNKKWDNDCSSATLIHR